jgi:hypothetical protein
MRTQRMGKRHDITSKYHGHEMARQKKVQCGVVYRGSRGLERQTMGGGGGDERGGRRTKPPLGRGPQILDHGVEIPRGLLYSIKISART